ncbi:hypothetical protein OG943_10730 [Amycolatopsis sp. NBC_00345]|uniref:hypothetical protein n=1 Tax=Amycolatopsis sp. NBC_00345 TaxID=2975955 RepID=UPI002E274130
MITVLKLHRDLPEQDVDWAEHQEVLVPELDVLGQTSSLLKRGAGIAAEHGFRVAGRQGQRTAHVDSVGRDNFERSFRQFPGAVVGAEPGQRLRARELCQRDPSGFAGPDRRVVPAVRRDPRQLERAEPLGQQRRRLGGRDEPCPRPSMPTTQRVRPARPRGRRPPPRHGKTPRLAG